MSTVPYILALIAVLLLFALRILARIDKRLEGISSQLFDTREYTVPRVTELVLEKLDRLDTQLDAVSTNTYKSRPDVKGGW